MPIVVDGAAVVPIPGCQDFATLKSRVASYLRKPDSSDILQIAGYEINSAVRKLNSENWNWALTSTTITLVAATATYDLPTNFRAARMLERLTSGSVRSGKIYYLDPKTFNEETGGSSSGTPTRYTVHNFTDTQLLTLD